MRALVLAAALLAAGCASRADLSYTPTRPLLAAPHPVIATVRVVDRRWVADPDYAGAVMGSYGRPFRRLETPKPLADEVARAFRNALAARGDLAPAGLGRYDLDVTILHLDAEQWAERQGRADLLVRLVERATGRVVYSDRTYAESRGYNYLAIDNFELGSPAALDRVADAVLSRSIDRALGTIGFAVALR